MKIDFRHNDYIENKEYDKTVNDCFIGTKRIKTDITRYLRRNYAESTFDYEIRCDLATYLNYVGKTINSVNGMLHRKKHTLDYKLKYDKFFKDVDGEGTSFLNFSSKLTQNAMISGVSYLWVDAPNYNGIVSKYDLENSGAMPVFKNIKRSELINWDSKIVNGRRVLTLAVMEKIARKRVNEFETEDVKQYVVLRINGGAIYEKEENGFKIVNEWTNSLGYIPLFAIYSKKEGYFKADIPFLDLSEMNLSLFKETADDSAIKKKTRNPLLMTFGFEPEKDDDGKEIEQDLGLDSGIAFASKTENGMMYLEANPEAMKASAQDLKEMKKDLETFSLNVFSKFSYNTATEAMLNDKKSSLFLDELADSLEDTLIMALKCVEDYIDDKLGFKIEIKKDFDSSALTPEMLDKLILLKNSGLVSLDTILKKLVDGEIIEIDSIEEEKGRIKKEEESLSLADRGEDF